MRLLLAAVLVLVPLAFPHFYLLLATEILIMGLFAVAFNLLLGYAGMVSFGHAAFYGLGAYACGLLLKKAGAPFAVAFLAAPVLAAAAALVFGLLCIRLTRIYFSMLTLAFSQIVWAVAHKWYSLTGGDNGLVAIPVPEALAGPRAFYLFTLACTGLARRGALAPRQCAVRPDPARDPGERRARGVRGRPRQAHAARWPSSSRAACPASPGRCSRCSAAGPSPTTRSGRSRRRSCS